MGYGTVKIIKFATIMGILLVSSGCNQVSVSRIAFWRQNQDASPDAMQRRADRDIATPSDISGDSRESAEWLETRGKYPDALLIYRKLSASGNHGDERDTAILGTVRCLLKMGKAPAALASLHPLPESARTLHARKRLALAAQALLLLKDPVRAEAYLELALNGFNPNLSESNWAAPVYANYAKACLENDKPDKAANAYRLAATQYALADLEKNASACFGMATALEKISDGACP